MTAKKSLLLVVLSLVALFVIGCGVLLLPSFQTWLILRIANGQPGLKLEASDVHLGSSGLHAENLRATKDGLVIQIPAIDAEFSPVSAALSKKVTLSRLVVHGVKVDTREYRPVAAAAPASESAKPAKGSSPSSAPSSPSAPSKPFSGLLDSAQLPVELTVGQVEIDGDALIARTLPATPLETHFKITGGGLAPGTQGTFNFAVNTTDSSKDAEVSAIDLKAVLNLSETKTNALDGLKLDFEVSTSGRLLAGKSEKLKGVVDLKKAGDGEDYKFSVAIAGAPPLVEMTTHYSATARRFEGQWTLSATKAQVAPYALGNALPEFTAAGQGKYSLDAKSFAEASAQGDLTVKASQLQAVLPPLSEIGPLNLTTHFELGWANDAVRVNKFTLKLDGAKPLLAVEALQAATLHLQTHAITYEKAGGDFLRATIAGLPLSWAKPFLTGSELTGDDFRGEILVSPAGEGFALKTSRPLGIDKFSFRQAGKAVLTDASIHLDPTASYDPKQIVANLAHLTFQTPAGDSAAVAVHLTKPSDPTLPLQFDATLKAKLVGLAAGLPPTGVDGSLAGSMKDSALSIQKMSFTVEDSSAQTLLSLLVAQPFSVNPTSGVITPQDASRDLASVKFLHLPLSLAAPFAGKFSPTGDVTAGNLIIGVSGETFRFKTAPSVQISKLGLALEGKPALANLDFSIGVDGTYSAKEARLNTVDLNIKSGASAVLDFNANAKFDLKAQPIAGTVKLTLNANLAALLSQPFGSSGTALRAGRLAAHFDASLGKIQSAIGEVTIDQLAPALNGPLLPSLLLKLKSDLTADHQLTVDLPLVLTGANRKSDLTLHAKATVAESGTKFTADLQSENIFTDDFQALAALLPVEQPPEATRANTDRAPAPTARASTTVAKAAPAPVRDTVPSWQGYQGQAKLALKKIAYGTYLIEGVEGNLVVDPTRVEVPSFGGKLGGTPFKLDGKIAFDPKEPIPYALTGSIDVTGFDTGKFLRAANPKDAPIVETVIATKASAHSRGLNLEDLLAKIQGDATVTAKSGTLHLLPSVLISGDKAAGVLGLLGSAVEGTSPTAAAAAKLAAFLFAVPIEMLSVKANRDQALNIHLTDLFVNSSQLHITGSGEVTNVPDKPFTDHLLSLKIELSAAESIAQLFNQLGILGQPPKDNFYPVELPVTIKGTVGKPDRSELDNALKNIAIKEAAGGVFRLLGK